MSFGFVLVFFIFNLAVFLKGETIEKEEEHTADLVSAVWIGAFLVPWIFIGIDRELQSLVLSAWAVLFASGAFICFVRTGNRKPLFAYVAVGIFLLGTATARELEGAALTIAFTLEAGALTFLSYMLLRDRAVAIRTSILFALPAFLSLESIAKYPVHERIRQGYDYFGASTQQMTPIFHEHFFVLLLLALTLTLLGCIFMVLRTGANENADHATLAEVSLVAGTCYGYVLLWLSLHEAFVADSATMMALVLYTLIGLTVYLYGRKNDHRGLRVYGGTLLGFVVGRLLLVEVWKMELTGRIITFFVIGTLLMSTAFFSKKKKEINVIPPTL
jgi:cbb3-type cytochrome oxidase subunit 3